MQIVDSAAEVEGQAGLHLLNARELDAFQNVADKAVVQEGPDADRQIVSGRHRAAVSYVEV